MVDSFYNRTVYLKKTTYEYIMDMRRKQIEKMEEKNAANNARKAHDLHDLNNEDTSTTGVTDSSMSYRIEKISTNDTRRIYPLESSKSEGETKVQLPELHDFKRASSVIVGKEQTPVSSRQDTQTEATSESIVINCATSVKTPREEDHQSPRKQSTSPLTLKSATYFSSHKVQHQNINVGDEKSNYFGCNEFSGVDDVLEKSELDLEEQSMPSARSQEVNN